MTDKKPQEEVEIPDETPAEVEVSDTVEKPANSDHVMDAASIDLSKKIKADASAQEILDVLLDMQDTELLPWEEIVLPSRGQYYDGKIPGGIVKVKPMGAQDDKILATQRLAASGQSLEHLFKHCVQLPEGIDPADLLGGDRVFLLYVLRGITHGNMYEFIVPCPSCELKSTHQYDLNTLASTITGPSPGLDQEPFKIVLPYMSESLKQEVFVTIKLLRGRDVNQYTASRKFKKRITPGAATEHYRNPGAVDDTLTEGMMLSLVSWMGEVTDEQKLRRLVDRLHSRDLAVIREFLKNNTPGIDTTINVSCPGCGTEFKTELPITEGFFRPSGSARSGT